MVVKGSARGGAGELAYHLLRVDTNETVNVLEFAGVASKTLRGALLELDAMGAGSRSKRTLYHASINTPVAEQLTPEQQTRARERLALELGLQFQPYAVVEHVKHGRQHTHIVWSRIDTETAKAIPDAHNYRKHEIVCRELEREFGHERVLGAHVRDKANEPRPPRGPDWGEQRQAERSGMTLPEARRIITECWQQTGTGQELRERLAAQGFVLARGDRRDFVLVDGAGEIHGLARRIEGAKAKDIRDRLADIDAASLPAVEDLRRRQEPERQKAFVTTLDRLRADDKRKEAQEAARQPAPLSNAHQEAADAIWQLRRTMRDQIDTTMPGTVRQPQPRIEPAEPTPAAKESLYYQAKRARERKTESENAADALRRQEDRRRQERSREPGR